MRAHLRTKGFLATTTAMTTGILPTLSLGVGLFAFSTGRTLADDPVSIPLEYLKDQDGVANRLGIWAKINNGKAQRYIFDTGSDQLNTQIGSEVTEVQPIPGGKVYVYTYGNGTYGYKLQQVEINKFTYVDPKDKSKEIDGPQISNQKYKVGRIIDFVYSSDYDRFKEIRHSSEPVTRGLKDIFDKDLTKDYYADLDQRASMNKGDMAEEDGNFAGTFGAGDYLFKTSAWGMMGSATKTGYIISANADVSNNATPGCSPCTIVNLNPSLRAQFTNMMPWGNQDRDDVQAQFPGSGANASTEFEGAYELGIAAAGGQGSVSQENVAVLLDTGTPGGGSLSVSQDVFDGLKNSGADIRVNPEQQGQYYTPALTLSAPNGDPVTLNNVTIDIASSDDPNNPLTNHITFVAGLDFFLDSSVTYDLQKQTTAYTSYFVSANDFTTDAPAAGETRLDKITPQMGNPRLRDRLDANGQPVLGQDGKPVQVPIGQLGVAGVISGAGDLTIGTNADVRMTNVNTYTGATYINNGAYLFLAGLGSIERSANVVVDGVLDISERGNANNYWGIPDSENDARIRSLGGGGAGTVALGDRTLVLTAAGDTFAGSISDLDDQNKNMGGGLLVAGGVQTLSGRNDYSGMTTVGSGAGLLLTETGSIAHDVTTSGFLGNDGHIEGIAKTSKGGVVAGAGSFGAVNVAGGGTVAPGSALDPGKAVTALTVKGDFTQQASSIYQAGLASSSDRINVDGSAAIDGGAQIELLRQGTGQSIDKRYTLLTAADGVNGTYADLTGTLYTDSPFVDFELTYDPTNVYLDTSRSATAFAAVGNTFNQRSVGAASQTLGAGNPVHDNILFLTAQESRNAFDLLSGEIHASVHSALIQDSHFVRDAANDRIRAAFEGIGASPVPVMAYGPGGAESAPATTDKYAVWGQGFGAWGHFDGDGNAAHLDRSTGGFIAGGDALVGEQWRIGLLAGYSHSSFDVDDRASSGSSDNYHLGLYAGTQHGNLGFRSGLAYTWHRIETDRSVVLPGFADSLSADYEAGTFQAFGELGYRLDTTSASFEPYANLAYVKFDADGFAEDSGAAALSVGDQSSDTTFTTLGLRASTELTFGAVNTTVRGAIGWRHAFGDDRPETGLAFAGGSSFAIEGVPIARNAALLEAGLDVKVTENAKLGIAYQGQIASDAQEHGFNAKLGVRF
jgi:outer membrane autotransporter protein